MSESIAGRGIGTGISRRGVKGFSNKNKMPVKLELSPKQTAAFQSDAQEILYGGAAFGGKSFFLRVIAVFLMDAVPGIQIFIFRRTLPDLRNNHLRGPTSFHALMEEGLRDGRIQYRAQENEFVNPKTGSRIALSYCQYEDDVVKFQGAEIHVLLMDELTHFTEYIYRYLRSRVRIVGVKIPPNIVGKLPRIVCGSNPGGIGHAWVKRMFVNGVKPNGDLAVPGEVWQTAAEDGGMTRQYIPAKMTDNPQGMTEDPQYGARLDGLGSPDLVRAMKDGDWDIVAGQAFEKLRRNIHGIEPFTIPEEWMKFRSMDWGSSKPFAVGWYAVSDGNELPDGRSYPRGALIKYREWYGWNGSPDQGARLETGEVARGVRLRSVDEHGQQEKYAYSVADPAMWKVDGGPSHAEQFMRYAVILRKAANARKIGYLEVRNRLAGDEEPMFYAFNTCLHFWRTMPDLVLDETNPEDVDTDQEDHVFDETRYACMSRPYVRAADKSRPTIWPQGQTFDQLVKGARTRRLESA